MSTASHIIHNTNSACCTIPPVQSEYTPKGTFKSVGDFKKVYVTGQSTDTAIVCVYDIFGYFPQTQQGADIIASTLKTVVYMPDFFEPNAPFPSEDFPPTTDAGKRSFQFRSSLLTRNSQAKRPCRNFSEELRTPRRPSRS
jgi:dienelactone hydrolase